MNKRDIVEVAEELGIELTYHEGVDRPYYTAFCPLHDNVRTPSFAIFPGVQRFYCYTCAPEGGDVVDLIMRKEGLNFVQAKKRVMFELSPEEEFVNKLARTKTTIDTGLLQLRAAQINDPPRRLNFQTAQRILRRFDELFEKDRLYEADRLLRSAGV